MLKHSIKISMLALTVSCAFSTTADAQLLKKLGNLAKTAVANETKSKINNESKHSTTTESNTVESTTVEEPNRSSSNSSASEPKKEIRAYADASDYSQAHGLGLQFEYEGCRGRHGLLAEALENIG